MKIHTNKVGGTEHKFTYMKYWLAWLILKKIRSSQVSKISQYFMFFFSLNTTTMPKLELLIANIIGSQAIRNFNKGTEKRV